MQYWPREGGKEREKEEAREKVGSGGGQVSGSITSFFLILTKEPGANLVLI